MNLFVSGINHTSKATDNAPKKTTDFKGSFFEKINKHANKIGYFPVIGTFIGIRRIYKEIKNENINKWELLRGTLEIIVLGPILAIIDFVIYSVRIVSEQLKRKKNLPPADLLIHTSHKSVKSPPIEKSSSESTLESPKTKTPAEIAVEKVSVSQESITGKDPEVILPENPHRSSERTETKIVAPEPSFFDHFLTGASGVFDEIKNSISSPQKTPSDTHIPASPNPETSFFDQLLTNASGVLDEMKNNISSPQKAIVLDSHTPTTPSSEALSEGVLERFVNFFSSPTTTVPISSK